MANIRKTSQNNCDFITYKDLKPASLDLAEIEENFPPLYKYYKREVAYKLVTFILNAMYIRKDADEFVELHSKALKKLISDYSKYRDYLEAAGVIEACHAYKLNYKSKSYKVSDKYLCDGFDSVTFSEKRDKYEMFRKNKIIALAKFPEIAATIGNIQIDPEVYRFLEVDEQRKLNGEAPKDTYQVIDPDKPWKKITKVKKPENQHRRAKFLLEKLKEGNHNLTLDSTVNRLHHMICSLPSITRSFLKFPNSEISQVDISSSQFFSINRVIQPGFWNGKDNYINLNNLKEDIKNKYEGLYSRSLYPICAKDSNLTEFLAFADITCSGKFYQTFISETLDIDQVKQKCFEVLFSSPRAPINRKWFKDVFPNIWKIMAILQLQDKEMPKLLQNLESCIILNNVVPRIYKDIPGIQIIPIHDCIVAPTSQIKAVEAIMVDEIAKCIGFTPHVKITHYSPDTAAFKDKVPYSQYKSNKYAA
jgi:hypothetical protein